VLLSADLMVEELPELPCPILFDAEPLRIPGTRERPTPLLPGSPGSAGSSCRRTRPAEASKQLKALHELRRQSEVASAAWQKALRDGLPTVCANRHSRHA
jgi:hypothetical protein